MSSIVIEPEDDEAELLEVESAPDLFPEQAFIVAPEEAGKRLDVFIAEKASALSRSQVQRIVGDGGIRINGALVKSSYKVCRGDQVELDIPDLRPATAQPEDIPLDIVFEDADMIVLNKQKGLVVHPAAGATSGTLVNALLYHCTDLSGIGGVERPGIVHRLDKDTSGLMMVAKNDVAHRHLQAQIQSRAASRKYMAIVWGRPTFNEAVIDAAIARHPSDRKKMAVVDPGSITVGRNAVTNVFVREALGPMTLIECVLQTGRTHQIRVHLSYIGHPVVGDPIYGGTRRTPAESLRPGASTEANALIDALHGQALHAYSLSFNHPRTDERMTFTLPLPAEMEALVTLLRSRLG